MSDTTPSVNALLLSTIKELKEGVSKLADRIDDINGRVAFVEGADLKSALESIDKRLKQLEEKVSRLDKNQAVIYGVIAVFGAIAGFFGTFIEGLFGGK